MNDFHISDDEEKNSPRLSFLKTKKVNRAISNDALDSSTPGSEGSSPDAQEDVTGDSLPKSQNDDREVGREIITVKPTPRMHPVKRSTSSGKLGNY
jgi:microtubule-associated protein 9